AGSEYHAPLIRRRADDDRFAAQSWVVALLDRGIERIHIEMEDDTKHAAQLWITAPILAVQPRFRKIFLACWRTDSISSRGCNTTALSPQPRIQRSISPRLERHSRSSNPPLRNSRNSWDGCQRFSRI